MTDDTLTTRRALLTVLLSRAERGVLLDAEGPLLRLLVQAEMAAAERAALDGQPTMGAKPRVTITLHDEATSAAVRPLLDDLDRETRRSLAAEAAIARVRAYADRIALSSPWGRDVAAGVRLALDGPSPTPATDSDDASDVEVVAANDIPTDWARGTEPRCPARYTGPTPGTAATWAPVADYRCELRAVTARRAAEALRLQVRAALREAKVSQASAAAQLGITEKHLSQMLTGRVKLGLDWAEQLLGLCGQALALDPRPMPGPQRALSALPAGPALVYVTTAGGLVPVDREAVPDRRERRLFRALVGQAEELADKADTADEGGPKNPTGFAGPSGVGGAE
jgi:hypothetical protein